MLKDGFLLARPKHWVKSVFVLMPLPFALADGATVDVAILAIGVICMSAVASGVYVINDWRDRELDRLHPEKSQRPIASGRVSSRQAVVWMSLCFLVGLGPMVWLKQWIALELLLLYIVINLIYCFGAKNVALLDVFLLSSGYVIRVVLGCALIGVAPSNWLLLCSSALALFLALTKRRADLVKGFDETHRPSLAGYNIEFLNHAMAIMGGMSILAYSLYCMEASTLVEGREFVSLPFVVFGVLDYLRVAHLKQEGGSPVELLLRSPVLLFCALGWVVSILFSTGAI